MQTKADRPRVPRFATEAEEAKWWDDHKEMVEENLVRAIVDGTARRDAAGRLSREARASRNVTIRMAEADLDLARQQAEAKGLPYQTYIKSVLHEELLKRGLRRAS
jgi:predicted DNA binding CopG/RHH family protein